MDNLQSTENTQEKELDLIDIIKACWRFLLTYLIHPIIYLIRLGLKKWYYFIIAIGVATLLSLIMPYITDKKYSIFMLVRNNVQQSSDFVNLIKIAKEEGPLAWQEALNLTNDELAKVKSFDAHHIYARDSSFVGYQIDFKEKLYKHHKGIINPNMFAVEFETTDLSLIQKLQESSWSFLNSDPYINLINQGRLDKLKARKSVLDNEIILLDSLRHFEYFEKNRSNLLVQSSYKEGLVVREEPTRLMHSDMIALTSEFDAIKQQLEIHSEPIELVLPMQVRGVAINDWTRTILPYSLILIALTYLILLIVQFHKEIKSFIHK